MLLGIRTQTLNIDIKLDPEPLGIFETIAILKDRLEVNVELASPDLFLPPLPGWHERSEFIRRCGRVDFYHYDFYSQALAKILRGHETDLSDARHLVELGKVAPDLLATCAQQLLPDLIRYPAVSKDRFWAKVEAFVASLSI